MGEVKSVKGSQRGPELWAHVRREYESGLGHNAIVATYGIPGSTLQYHIRKEGWKKPPKAKRLTLDAVADPTPGNVEAAVSALEQVAGDHVFAPAPVPSSPQDLALAESNEQVLQLSELLALRLKGLLASPDATDTTLDYRARTRGLLDLANVLERLQTIQRKALGADTQGGPTVGTVVIVAPGKASEEDWQARVAAPGASGPTS